MSKWFRGPFTEPESEDDAYDRRRQEMDDDTAKAAEERFEAYWEDKLLGEFTSKELFRETYIAADAEATKRTAQRCVEICHQMHGDWNVVKLCIDAIAKEFGL